MQFGLMYDFRNPTPWEAPAARLYAETIEQIQAVEALGFDAVWLTEHHFTDDGYLPQVLTVAAAVAAVTRRVQIGTAVLLLPLHHPLHVAEQAALVDIISDGRLIFGPGLGYKVDEFAAFGVNRGRRRTIMDESVEIIARAWTEERFSYAGRHFQLTDLSVTPRPVQQPRPPIWLAARAEPPLRRAARLGDGVIAVGSPDLIGRYRELVREAGKDPEQATVAVLHSVLLSDEPEQTWREVKDHVAWRARRYGEWYGEAADLPGDQRWREAVQADEDAGQRPERLIRDVDTLTRELEAYERMGVDHVIFFATFPGYPLAKSFRTWEHFAREVMPRFRGSE